MKPQKQFLAVENLAVVKSQSKERIVLRQLGRNSIGTQTGRNDTRGKYTSFTFHLSNMVITGFYKRSGCPRKCIFFETYVLLASSTGEKNTLVSKNKIKFRQTSEKNYRSSHRCNR